VPVQPVAPAAAPAPVPSVGPFAAIARHPFLFVLLVLLCTAGGVYVGIKREPMYTAEARLNVGNVDVNSEALPGYVVATQSLAASYSRGIDSQEVVRPVAMALHRSQVDVADHIEASPIPESSVIRVEATALDRDGAVRLVNAASQSLARYVRGLNPAAETTDRLLAQYREAEIAAARAGERRRGLARRYASNPTPDRRVALREATATLNTAKLQVQALAARYQSAQQDRPVNDFVQRLTTATTATSDRNSALTIRAFTGAVAGILLGAALVTALSNRRRRRS
jgi:hypothetical protein